MSPLKDQLTKSRSGQKLLGLFELDENGNVLYSSVESGTGSLLREYTIDGRNFFTQVVPFANAAELQRRFELFLLAETQSHSFGFCCQYEDGDIPVRVLMARLLKSPSVCSYLIHLRKP